MNGPPSPFPCISVIVRSQNRPCLAEAVASVAMQTWPSIEIVLVNTTALPHPWPYIGKQQTASLALLMVNADGRQGPLDRACAANAGLRAATGHYALFLDDDDLLNPPHLERLAHALSTQSDCKAAYAGVFLEIDPQKPRILLDEPFDPVKLVASNFLPIHAVLFETRLVRERALSFDEAFALFEDWDFWIALSRHTLFFHVPGGSAVYRRWLGASNHLGAGEADHRKAQLTALYGKWQARLEPAFFLDVLLVLREKLDFWHDQTQAHIETQQSLHAENARLAAQNADQAQMLSCMTNSLSWRIITPLRRWRAALIADRKGNPKPP
jgi:glycosyltransferase involved in cell wall biosynthesis